MRSLVEVFKRFLSDEEGLETVEYAVIGALITVAAVIAIWTLGASVTRKFQSLDSTVNYTPSP